ncbi:Hypothetical_protein [Hexamita inflata]|uniref:Hypothetical_protein n=1 Tax=Hexamita inflata TaxID=28002 RepID=A0AA86UTK8_9EUKA|nr:Hypothetical protein HINF_LOCUS51811 [Hexamita inflata]
MEHWLDRPRFSTKSQELCNIICQLNQNQRNKFWYYLADNISPKTDIRKLRSYFVSTYQQNQFTDILSNEDIISIKNEYIKNFNNFSKLNSIEITKLIINKLFQQKSLFFNDVHKQIALAQKDAKHKSKCVVAQVRLNPYVRVIKKSDPRAPTTPFLPLCPCLPLSRPWFPLPFEPSLPVLSSLVLSVVSGGLSLTIEYICVIYFRVCRFFINIKVLWITVM